MRTMPIAIAALLLGILSTPVRADPYASGLVGNDTGGIIPWSPEAEHYRFAIAGDFCARYGKVAHISSVHRQYGDYIGFHCWFPPSASYYGSRRPVVVTKY